MTIIKIIRRSGMSGVSSGGSYFLTDTVSLATLPRLSLTKNSSVIMSPWDSGLQTKFHSSELDQKLIEYFDSLADITGLDKYSNINEILELC